MICRALSLGAITAAGLAAPAAAQSYRLRLDARAQAVSFRGLIADSVAASDVVAGPGGGLVSPEGFAVSCAGGSWCYFFRSGPEIRRVPVSTTATLAGWGFGVTGLSLHATGRLITDANGNAWPTTDPTVQLLEGYLEYDRGQFRGRAGRLLLSSRLEHIGMDGAWGRVRWDARHLDLAAYGGFGLGQAATVGFASQLLNPLDEWRPRDRQLVAGAEVGWAPGPADVRLEYRREVDPETDYFVSERAAASFTVRPLPALRATGGADYNLAEGVLGSADLTVSWHRGPSSLTAGARRYRPYFSLWTLWGAFSPIPYHAIHGTAQLSIAQWLSLRARGERYWYEAAEAATPLVNVEDRGWRVSSGATIQPLKGLVIDGSWITEFGPGASTRHFDGTASFAATEAVTFGIYGGTFQRPLELRYYQAEVSWIGGRAEWRPGSRWKVWGDVAWFDERRDRPDPAATSFDRFRLRSGVSLEFGSSADRSPLPPARKPTP